MNQLEKSTQCNGIHTFFSIIRIITNLLRGQLLIDILTDTLKITKSLKSEINWPKTFPGHMRSFLKIKHLNGLVVIKV